MRGDEGPVWQEIFASVAEEGRWIGAEAPVADLAAQTAERFADQDDRVMLLAQLDGMTVGWISVELEDDAAEIGMGILAGYRRLGVGTAMVETAMAWATTHSAERVRLDVFPHNEAAIGLYRKLGFVEVGRQPAAWQRRNGERWDLIVMERPLGSRSSPSS
jgi:ribosomal protein S18 acetylase RimI-like enzyme